MKHFCKTAEQAISQARATPIDPLYKDPTPLPKKSRTPKKSPEGNRQQQKKQKKRFKVRHKAKLSRNSYKKKRN